jgi:hypothetical protein
VMVLHSKKSPFFVIFMTEEGGVKYCHISVVASRNHFVLDPDLNF